jgi:hypothetical protein
VLTADGCQEVLDPVEIGCCPPPLCGNELCCTFVAFFNLLPSGPLWDYWKAAAISYFQINDDPKDCPLLSDPHCPSLVLHAIYTVLKLKNVVHNALWPAFRESNPYTAITTLDAHLARLQWEDCYAQHCRSVLLGETSAYELMGECGPVYCPVELGEELDCAVKRNIAIALTRAQMSPIKNLCGLNWIIEPLGAEIKPVLPQPPNPPPDPNPDSLERCDNTQGLCVAADPPQFMICRTRDWLEGCGSGDVCDTLKPPPKIHGAWGYGCGAPAGLPAEIWPGVMAAECIVRSLMPWTCPPNITSNHPDCC